MNQADLILHPVRLRIVQTFLGGAGGRRLTAQEVAASLPDVPQATLYRHLNRLVSGRVLTVVEERQVRGTVERIYGLAEGATDLRDVDIANITREDHLRYFAAFVSSLIADYSRYLSGEHIDLEADGASFREAVLYLSDDEYREFMRNLGTLVQDAVARSPAPGRRRRIHATIIIPEADTAAPPQTGPEQDDKGRKSEDC